MDFAEFYSERYSVAPKIFNDNPRSDTGIIVVIPCYDDEFLFSTLQSLDSAKAPSCSVEVIVVVNSAEDTDSVVVEHNRSIYAALCEKRSTYHNFRLLPHIIEGVAHKIAGVGNARKIGMDEAVWRFASIERPRGIIVSLDADCLVSDDYFLQIYERFNSSDNPNACTLQYKHNFDPELYSEQEINACRRYEMYLRYFRLAQKVAGIPVCMHTIGSCLAVNAETYAKMGGMSRRQAGEDFYLLQKIAQQSPVAEVAKPIVFPAPSASERVPFGTGRSVRKIMDTGSCKVYNFELFLLLRKFYSCFTDLYSGTTSGIPDEILSFVGKGKMDSIIAECRNNTSDCKNFVRRMISKFDVFHIIRFLNSFDDASNYPSLEVETAVILLLKYYGLSPSESIYDDIFALDLSVPNCSKSHKRK